MNLLISSLFEGKDTLFIISQIIGFVIIIENFFIFFQKKRGKILFFKLLSDVMNVFQNVLARTFTGAAINVIAIGRESVFYFRDKKKWASSKFWLYFFAIIVFLSPFVSSGAEFFSYVFFVSFLPAIGSVFMVVGFFVLNPHMTRILGFIAMTLWIVYYILLGNYIQIVSTGINILSIVIGLIMDFKEKKKLPTLLENNEEELESTQN